MKKKIIIPVLVVLLLVTGCRKVPKLENGQEKVVSFDEGGISVDDLYDQMKSKYALNILLDMVDKEITDKKYEVTDEEKEYIANQKSTENTYYEILYKNSYSTFERYIQAKYGVSTTEALEEIYRLSYRRNQLIEDYLKEHISESEIKDYFENSYIGDIEASHILITAEYSDTATDEEKEAAENKALETAKEVIKKLDEGADFAELAKEYSKDGSADDGGSLGRFGHGDMVSEFEEAAYALEVGKYTKEPVKTKFGYHIILKTKDYGKGDLEDAKEEIIETLVDNKLNEEANITYKTLIEIRDDYGVTIEDSTLKDQYENYKSNYS